MCMAPYSISTNHRYYDACYRFPGTELATEVEAIFDAQFTADKVAVELKLFEQEYNYSFERTYGWAWFLKLQQVG